jgi:hypothetical protein
VISIIYAKTVHGFNTECARKESPSCVKIKDACPTVVRNGVRHL